MNAKELNIPDGFRYWGEDPAEDRIGPFFNHILSNDSVESVFRVQKHNCNAYGSVHGGVLMTFADYTICLAAIGESNEGCITVSFNCEFVAPVQDADLVYGFGDVVKRTRSLVFTKARLVVNDEPVLVCSGVIKRVYPKS